MNNISPRKRDDTLPQDTSNEISEILTPPHQNIFMRLFTTYDKLFILLLIIGSLNSGYINLY